MGNVSLPTPVFLAGGALCLLAGYLLGSVAGPDTPDRSTARVVSFDRDSSRLCLEGDATKDQAGAEPDGMLCGIWRETRGAKAPAEGDDFSFVSISNAGNDEGHRQDSVLIYGDVRS